MGVESRSVLRRMFVAARSVWRLIEGGGHRATFGSMNLLRERWWPGRPGFAVASLVAAPGVIETYQQEGVAIIRDYHLS